MSSQTDSSYDLRIRREQEIYADQVKVHDLPSIFHYWSNKHLKPLLESFGYSGIDDLFAQGLMKAGEAATKRNPRFVSVGAGNCDTEVRVATILSQRGLKNFEIECLDINSNMLERGNQLAREAGVSENIVTVQTDFNSWKPADLFDGAMANQSLHHVADLEVLLDSIRDSLVSPTGLFIVSDIIGRNGHLRWPEARKIIEEFWRELPSRYKYHLQLSRQEDQFMDWDCLAGGGFEGIRAQEILGLLLERFHFEFFLGVGNLIDPFIDRGFGHHFDENAQWDRDFIDRVHARDETEILAGRLKPTHMFAIMQRDPAVTQRYWKHLTAEFCRRELPSTPKSRDLENDTETEHVNSSERNVPSMTTDEIVTWFRAKRDPRHNGDDAVAMLASHHPRTVFIKTLPPDLDVLQVGPESGPVDVYLKWPAPARKDLRLFAFANSTNHNLSGFERIESGNFNEPDGVYRDKKFGAIICTMLLQRLLDPASLVQWISDHSLPQARIYLDWPSPFSALLPSREELKSLNVSLIISKFSDDASHVKIHDRSRIVSLLSKSGFFIESQGYLSLPYLENEILAHYTRGLKDEYSLQTAYWSKTKWMQHVVGVRQ